MKEVTYLIYCLFNVTLLIGGCGYVVFVLGNSGWWFLLAILLCCMGYSPLKWIHGVDDTN